MLGQFKYSERGIDNALYIILRIAVAILRCRSQSCRRLRDIIFPDMVAGPLFVMYSYANM